MSNTQSLPTPVYPSDNAVPDDFFPNDWMIDAPPRCFWITDGEICNKIFDDGVKLGDHVEIYHQQQYQRDCLWKGCGKIFKTKVELKVHIWAHHINDMPFECDICQCRFESTDDLKVHDIAHDGQVFKCAKCKKECKTLMGRRQHNMLVHQIYQDNFVCEKPNCGKACLSKSLLTEHVRKEHKQLNWKAMVPSSKRPSSTGLEKQDGMEDFIEWSESYIRALEYSTVNYDNQELELKNADGDQELKN